MRGKHQIAFGVDFLRTRELQESHYNDNGAFNFSGQYSNDPLLDFLTSKMNNFNQSGQQLNDLRRTSSGCMCRTPIMPPAAWWSTLASAGNRSCLNSTTTTGAANFLARPSMRAR